MPAFPVRAVVPSPTPAAEPPQIRPTQSAQQVQPAPSRNKKLTINLQDHLVEEAKNAFWVDRGTYATFSSWVAEALQRQIEDTMARHRLTALPQRPGDGLPPGRPLK
jgi:hypothetical protein